LTTSVTAAAAIKSSVRTGAVPRLPNEEGAI
jgi:hypothetical protein